jgi:hypothetical protein
VSAPFIVPFVVTNRTEKPSRAGRVWRLVRWLPRAKSQGRWSQEKTLFFRVVVLVCRGGVRTFAAAVMHSNIVGLLTRHSGRRGGLRGDAAHRLLVPFTRVCLLLCCAVRRSFFDERSFNHPVKSPPV